MKQKKGVILVGEPGFGKSLIARSFVKKILNEKICTFIKDPQVFSCNAASFQRLDSDHTLESIEERFFQYSDQVVFFFDEFHSLFSTTGLTGNSQQNQIKKFSEKFRYLIAATTEKEYAEFIENQPAVSNRRFEIIRVPTMKSEQIETALSQYLTHTDSKISFDPSIFRYIREKAPEFNPNTSSIDAAKSLLSSAIQKMTSFKNTSLEEKIANIKGQLEAIEHKYLNGDLDNQLEAEIKTLKEKQDEFANVRKEFKNWNLEADRIQRIEDHYLTLKRKGFRLTDANKKLKKGSQLIKEWLKAQVSVKILKKSIRKNRQALGLPVSLDTNLIDQLVSSSA